MLINAVGQWWLFVTGWKREYEVGGFVIDLAHPRLKLALEADGERWHMDVVREFDRDEALKSLGWTIRHYRYPALKSQPKSVKRQVRGWYWRAVLFNFRR
jgi:very-short-patch-repair endonuclease